MVQWLIIFAMLLFPIVSFAFPPDKAKEKTCIECHTLSKQEAEDILQKLKAARIIPPSTRFNKIDRAPISGAWSIECDVDGRKMAFSVNYSKKFVMPQIIPISMIKPQPERKVDFSKIPLSDALVLGKQDAKKKVVVFTDPDCPACAQLHEVIKKIGKTRKDVAFYIMMFPLPQHKEAYKKAQSILCEKSAALLDDAFAGKTLPDPKCSKDQLEKSIAVGKALQIDGTPSLVRGDGTIFNGPRSPEMIMQWIDGK